MWLGDRKDCLWIIACLDLDLFVRVWITNYCKLSLLRTIYGLWRLALNLPNLISRKEVTILRSEMHRPPFLRLYS